MYTLHLNVWTAIAWLIAATWIAVIFIFFRACRQQTSLQLLEENSDSGDLPSLSVIVAARNESACIEACIRSLFRQDYPDRLFSRRRLRCDRLCRSLATAILI